MLPYAVMFATLSMATALLVDSPERGVPWLYKGMVVWAFGWAFLDAYTIGANDVANSFANAVGSRTITHRQACMIACVGEFLGVMVLGKTVTDAVRKKMIQVDWFEQDPYVLALGMSCVNLGSGLWVLVATIFTMPVSTTHAVVGSILGIGIAAWGTGGVKWEYDGGFLGVVASWFISPVMAAVLGAVIYLSVKFLVLAHPDELALKRGIMLLPFYFFISFGIVTGFMLLKGAPAAKDMKYEVSIPIVMGIGVGFALLSLIFVVPWTRRTAQDNENLPWYTMFYHWSIPKGSMGYYEESSLAGAHDAAGKSGDEELKNKGVETQLQSQMPAAAPVPFYPGQPYPGQQYMPQPGYGQPGMVPGYGQPGMVPGYPDQMPGHPPMQAPMPAQYVQAPAGQINGSAFGAQMAYAQGEIQPVTGAAFGFEEARILPDDPWYTKVGKTVAPGFYMDIGALDPADAVMHARAFQAYPKTEEMFKMLQLTTCLFFSISHGANDIANALAPLATVWLVYSKGTLASKAPIPYWLLAYGAFALDVGLVLSGHHIMKALGNKLTLQSPSRGFCIELGAMFTVMVFSRAGVPVSTTHCMTGATTGVGLCNGDVNAVNWKLLAVIFGGWFVTCPAAGLVTGMVFWGLASSPKPMAGNGFFTGHYLGDD
eukprot:558797-Rhodomonas_salina.1